MKKLLCHLSAIIAGLFIFCSCSLPNISIQIGYDNETTFADLTELPETQTPDTRPAATTGAPETQTPVTRPAATTGAPETQTPVLPIETECTHTFDIVDGRCNGRCLNCDYLIPSIASFYDISELVIHNGKVLDSGSKHKILIYKNDTYTSYLAYDKQKKEFTIITSDVDGHVQMFVTIDSLYNCSFTAGCEADGEVICVATGRIDPSTYTLSGVVLLSDYEGPEYMRDIFTRTCEAFVDTSLVMFANYISNNSPYSISDFGFEKLKI